MADEPLSRSSAIVGIGLRLPGNVGTPAEFWNLLWQETEVVDVAPESRSGGIGRDWRAAFVRHAEDFDAQFFRLGCAADAMDPRHRQLLEVCWEAFEDAGVDPTQLNGERTGVFLGLSGERYQTGGSLGRSIGMAAGYLCHFFDIRGPVVTVDTTCSSSLVALHQAQQSLSRGECDLALVGGANILYAAVSEDPLGITSPDGITRPFDQASTGFGQGEGTIVIVLKRERDCGIGVDRVYACVLGSAINHDGRSASLTAPNPEAQARVISAALRAASILPESVQFVETHGTGTPIGDPIEVAGIAKGYGVERRIPLVIGSVKSNIGHLEAAAGLAGAVKAALAIAHRRLPASRHFQTPNPRIAWESVPVRVQARRGAWPMTERRLVAGVSSFGMSGTNAHAILSERGAEQEENSTQTSGCADSSSTWLVPISAATNSALFNVVSHWIRMCEKSADTDARDIAHAAACRRAHLPYRVAVVGRSAEDLATGLREWLDRVAADGNTEPPARPRRLAFVFSGQGSQWHGMARDLCVQQSTFRRTMARCSKLIEEKAGWNLMTELHCNLQESMLNETAVTQPVLFAVQASMFEMLKSWGIQATACVGHSAGEVAAGYAAGLLTLEESVEIICERARVSSHASCGAMAAVNASIEETLTLCAKVSAELEIAAVNAPRSVVITGPVIAVEEAIALCESLGMRVVKLVAARAFHSRQMRAASEHLSSAIVPPPARASQMAMISGMTGRPVERLDAEYWRRQMCESVQFAEAARYLLNDGITAFVEMAPHPLLVNSLSAVVQAAHVASDIPIVGLMRRDDGGVNTSLEAVGRLYCKGVSVDWRSMSDRAGCVADLPRYAWDHTHPWPMTSEVRQEAQSQSDTQRPVHASMACPAETEACGEPLRDLFSEIGGSSIRLDSAHQTLADLGFDSLALVRLGQRLDRISEGRNILPSPDTTVGELSRLLQDTPSIGPTNRTSFDNRFPVHWIRQAGNEGVYVWIHPAGGGIDCYRPLAAQLPHSSLAIDSPARYDSSGLHTSIKELAECYLKQLERVALPPTISIGGWSFGGVVAYEMARQWERKGRIVSLVTMIDSFAGPSMAKARGKWIDSERRVGAEAKSEVSEDSAKLIVQHTALLLKYRPRAFSGPVISIRAAPTYGGPDRAWKSVAQNMKVSRIDAEHFTIMNAARSAALAEIILNARPMRHSASHTAVT